MIVTMLGALLAGSVAVTPVSASGTAGDTTAAIESASGVVSATPDDEPAVRVTINSRNVFDAGDRARVRVRVRDDSYLIVVMADPSGRVRVLYPASPTDDDFVHAGEEFDVRGGGQDASFVVDGGRGMGTVYAAVSKDPFDFQQLATGSEWNYGAFPDSARGRDAESVLTGFVQTMAPSGGRFDYDLATYTVMSPRERARSDNYAYDDGNRGNYGDNGNYGDYGNYGNYGDNGDYGAYPPYPYYNPYYPYCDPWVCPGYGFAYNPWYSPYYSPFFFAGFGFRPFFFGFNTIVIINRPFGFRPFPFAPGGVIGFRPRGAFASTRGATLFPGRAGGVTPWQTHVASNRSTVFTAARLTTSRGGIASPGWRTPGGSATVFRHAQAMGPSAPPASGRLVVRDRAVGGVAQPARGASGSPMATHGVPGAVRVERGGQSHGSWSSAGASGSRNGDVYVGRGAGNNQGHRVEAMPEYGSRYGVQSRGDTHYETPHYETPHYDAPRYETPRYESPRAESPHSEPQMRARSGGGGGGGGYSGHGRGGGGGGGSSHRGGGGGGHHR